MATETNIPVVSGEKVEGPFLSITWQKGLATEVGINGCRVQDVLLVAAKKLEAYQEGPLACPENDEALSSINAAINAMESRRQRRTEQGVFNTMTAHEVVRTEDVDQDFSATGA